jgi:hypothetical protein
MKIDFILVGPWDRVSENGQPTVAFLDYVSRIRSFDKAGLVIYSSTDDIRIVDSTLFDIVCSNSDLLKNKLTGVLYYENSRIAIQQAKSNYIIRVRSDIYLKDFQLIYDVLSSVNDKIVIDYHADHTLLIPYYYSDFFLAAKTTKAKKLYGGSIDTNFENGKLLSFSPHKFLTAGRFAKNCFRYNEYLAWSCMLKNLGCISIIKSMHDLSFNDYVRSLHFLKSTFVLISRKQIFLENKRFSFTLIPNVLIFKSHIFDLNMVGLSFLYIYHNYLFILRTIKAIFVKFINYLRG